MGLLKKIKRRAVQKTREAFLNIAFRATGFVPHRIRQAKGLRILVYHGICLGDPHRFNARYLSTGQFEQQLRLITKFYNPISYQDLASGRLSGNRLNVLLTFDDGLKNNHTYALPLLKQYKVPALFFVTALAPSPYPYIFNDLTDIIPSVGPDHITIEGLAYQRAKVFLHDRYLDAEGKSLAHVHHNASWNTRQDVLRQLLASVPPGSLVPYKDYYELMGDAEIRDLSNTEGMAIGAHGAYHTDLSAIDATERADELKACADYLEQATGLRPEAIAFPYGSHNPGVLEACRKAGYNHCFGTEHIIEAAAPLKNHERLTVNPYVSAISQMYHLAKNSYD